MVFVVRDVYHCACGFLVCAGKGSNPEPVEFLMKHIETPDFGMVQENKVDDLISLINEIHGRKILTLAVSETSENFAIDVNEKGVFGYHHSHKALFCRKLRKALNKAGGLIIRQFLPLKVKENSRTGSRC